MLQHVKAFLRVDYDEEDDLIESFIEASLSIIKSSTGVVVTEDDSQGMLILCMLCARFYEDRNTESKEFLTPVIKGLLIQLEHREKVAENDKSDS